MNKIPIKASRILQYSWDIGKAKNDLLAVEEPLELRIKRPGKKEKSISITMRTPGDDAELALGFLRTEGLIQGLDDINRFGIKTTIFPQNRVVVELSSTAKFDMGKLKRHFYTNSSCGVCGKASIESLRTLDAEPIRPTSLRIDTSMISRLPMVLRKYQENFNKTGGLHASGLFDHSGELLLLKEDVGRHNALDKLIGSFLLKDQLPLTDKILLLSGRVSFELVQKAIMAGIPIIAAVGAPSSLAVEMAEEFNITLIGFLKENRFNVYAGSHRIKSSSFISDQKIVEHGIHA